MKKLNKALLTCLPLLALSIGGVSIGQLLHGKPAIEAKADELETYIAMESSFFTNWTSDAGDFKSTSATFWGEGYSFEALDTFFCGESKESWTGTLTSRTWNQSTQYVYFQLGAAMDYFNDADRENGRDETETPVHLTFHFGEYSEDFYNNTFVENPMTLRYFKIPDDKYAELTASDDTFEMSVDIVDGKTAEYGFASFGYLHVNQTKESTGNAMRYFLNHLSVDSRDWEINKRKEIFNSYWTNEAQREVFFASSGDNIDDHFSTNDNFVNHWYFDHNYFNNNYADERHFDNAISTNTFRPDGTSNMPFNNDDGFFRGWYESAEGHNNGFVASDALRYRFVSRPFVLSGTGLVSIKMAGKASLHVIDATVQNTDSQAADLAWIDNHAMNQDGSQTNIADSGFNTTCMVNHVINLETYLGRKIQLAIADIDTSGWSACYFDELVTYYESAPDYHVDVATQTNNSGTFYPSYADIYVNSANYNGSTNSLGVKYNEGNSINTANDNEILNHTDSSDYKAAHEVWKSYLDTVRGGNQGTNYCSSLTSDGVKSVLASYNLLSTDAKRIVCASDDFERVGEGDWYSINPTIYDNESAYSLASSLQYLANANDVAITIYSNNMAGVSFNNGFSEGTTAIVIGTVSIILITCVVALIARARKEKRHQ